MAVYAVGKALRLLRIKLDLSQKQAGQKAGVSRVTVSTWETGGTLPQEEDLAAYLKALGTTPKDFSLLLMRATSEQHKLQKVELLRLEFYFQERIAALRRLLSRKEDQIPPEEYRFFSQELKDKGSYLARQLNRLGEIESMLKKRHSKSSSAKGPKQLKRARKRRSSPKSSVNPGVPQVLSLLRQKIMENGFTQMQVQEPLGWGRSYISQLLKGRKSLRFDQLLTILDVIDLEPREFFAELYQLVPIEQAR